MGKAKKMGKGGLLPRSYMEALREGNIPVVMRHVNAGVHPDLRDTMGLRAASVVIGSKNSARNLQRLYEKGSNLRAKEGMGKSLAHEAVLSGDIDAFIKLKELGMPVDSFDEYGTRPVDMAAHTRSTEFLKVMRDLGVKFGRKNKKGKLPEEYADKYTAEVIKALRERRKIPKERPSRKFARAYAKELRS